MLAILSVSDHLHHVQDGEPLPVLDERVQAICRERFRRVDRFIQLALLGSAECVGGRTLMPDCGLYLSSGVGPVGSNVVVQEQLFRQRQLPKPFHFVNTLGSAVGHYVARNLGMAGQCLFVTRRGGAFQAALSVAVADLAAGVVRQALVGAVEECTLPLADHRRRQGLGPEVAVAEGSHWVLIQSGPSPEGAVPLSFERFLDRAPLVRRMMSDVARDEEWAFGQDVDDALRREWVATSRHARLFEPDLVFHDSRDAALLTRWLTRRNAGKLRFVSGQDRSSWLCLQLGA